MQRRGHGPGREHGREAHTPERPRQQSGRQALRNQVLPSDAQHAALARADRRAPKNAQLHMHTKINR